VQRKAQPRALEVNCNGRAIHLLKPSPSTTAPVPAPLAKALAQSAAPKLFAVLPATTSSVGSVDGSSSSDTKQQQQQQQQQRLLLESVLHSEGPRVDALACVSQVLNAVFSFAVTVERDSSSSSSAADSSTSATTVSTAGTGATTTAAATANTEGGIHGCVMSLQAGSGPTRQARFRSEQRFVSRVKQLKHCSVTRIVRPAGVTQSSSKVALLGVGAPLSSNNSSSSTSSSSTSSGSTSSGSSSSDQEERSRLNATLLDLLARHVDHALPAYCLPAAMAVIVNSKQHKQQQKGDASEADVALRGSLRTTLHHFTVVAPQRKAAHRSQQSQSPQTSPKQRRTSPKSSSPYFAKEAGSGRHASAGTATTATAAAAATGELSSSSTGSAQQQGPVVLHGACLTTWRQLPPAVSATSSTATATAATAAAGAADSSTDSTAAMPSKSSSTSSTVTYVPDCKCVLSTLPLYDTLRGLLLQQHQQQPTITAATASSTTTTSTSSSEGVKPPLSPSANYIRSLTLVAPVPPAAPQQWPFWGAGPIPTLDFPLQPLFHALSFDTVLAALKVLMLEGSLVITGSSASGRVLACESLKALLFPLRTSCHLYAPLLPASEVYSFWRAKFFDSSRSTGSSSSRSRSSSRSTSPHSSRRVSGGTSTAAAAASSDRISSSDLNSSSSSRRPFFVSLDSRLVHAATAIAAATAGAAHSTAGDDANSADADSCAVWGLALKEPCLPAVTAASSTVRTAEGFPLGGSGPGELALECVRRMLRQAVHIDLDNDEITLPPAAAAAAAGVSSTAAAAAAVTAATAVDVALAVQAGLPQGPVQQLRERVQQALYPELTTFDHVLPPQSRSSNSSSSSSSNGQSLASTVQTATELLSTATAAATTVVTSDVIPMHSTSQTDVALREAFLNFQAALLGRAKEFVTLEVQQSLLRFDSQAFVEAVCGYSAAAAAVSRSTSPTVASQQQQQQQQQYFSGAAAQSAAAAAAVATAAAVEFYGELFRTRSFAALLSDDVLSDVDCAALSAQLEARRLELTVVLDQDSSTTGAAKASSENAAAAASTASATAASSGTAATAQQAAALSVDTSDSAGEQLAQ
jgi:trimeric autotransporter adhesin